MELNTERLIAQLPKEPLRPIYLVAGVEPLRVLEAADAIRAHARAMGCTEREVFDAEPRDFKWEQLRGAFASMGLFSSQRLIEVRLPTGKPGKDGAALISEFCAAPPEGITLLIIANDWSKSHAGKWSEAIAKAGHLAIAWAVKPHELMDWLDTRLRSRGLRAERDAIAQLAARVEGNLLAAAQEVDKLALLAVPGQMLDVAAMQDLVADAARFDVFRLTDAALNGQPAQVTRVLAGLRAEGEAVPALLGMVIRELQIAEKLAALQARGGNLQAEFRAQRIWEAKQALYLRALKRHDSARWRQFLAEAGHIDRMAKGRAAGDAWLALERLLVAVAEPRALRLLPA
ncbi:DNA polymerase III subunit delta [Lysobacteraceae bacterium NML07-0707]|nr:DNA polymerase III subunit delta [Xanthomonadaceae bacterium NML07-0707]